MSKFDDIQNELKKNPKTWLITGVAGFIGSHLLENLLLLNQKVVGLDNFFSGHHRNLKAVQKIVGQDAWSRFQFVEGDLRDSSLCLKICEGVDFVLHHAAMGSVPRSIEDPNLNHEINVTGFLNILMASRAQNVKRLVYASSSAVYGDNADEEKTESRLGQCLSPYAVSKRMNELYAQNFHQVYGVESVGLRYFNIFGARQDPQGAYAAVIPKWVDALVNQDSVLIYGDGQQTRDFCFVKDVVQANILAATSSDIKVVGQVFNLGCGRRISLNELFGVISELVLKKTQKSQVSPEYKPARQGDIIHSCANASLIQNQLGFVAQYDLNKGLEETVSSWLEK